MHAVHISNGRDRATERPLIICGMHRSRTSLLAAQLRGAGVHLGDTLLEGSADNPRGHFEDVEIVRVHRHALLANGVVSEGYTTQASLAVPRPLEREAAALVAARSGRGVVWGWKDPRTTLFLDFWSRLLPEARYLVLFRRPWEVVESLFRRQELTFSHNPSFALDVWTHYNRLALDFARRHADTTLVCESTQVIDEPERLFESIRSRLGVALAAPPTVYDPALAHDDVSSGRAVLLKAACPAAHELYMELRDLAGSRSPLPEGWGTPESAVVDLQAHLLADWSRAAAASGEHGRKRGWARLFRGSRRRSNRAA